jgi:hypothetical protein
MVVPPNPPSTGSPYSSRNHKEFLYQLSRTLSFPKQIHPAQLIPACRRSSTFDKRAKTEFGDPFIELSAEDQLSLVKKVNKEAVDASHSVSPAPSKPFILMTRELTLLGYFTSEAGATKVLQYQAVPGSYKGCVPLSEAGEGRTWAT